MWKVEEDGCLGGVLFALRWNDYDWKREQESHSLCCCTRSSS